MFKKRSKSLTYNIAFVAWIFAQPKTRNGRKILTLRELSMKMIWKMGFASFENLFCFELFVLKSHYSKWLVTRHMSANHHGEQWIEKADLRRSSQRSELGRTREEEGTLWLDISQQQRIITWVCGSQSQKKKLRELDQKSLTFSSFETTQITQELPHFCDDFSIKALWNSV